MTDGRRWTDGRTDGRLIEMLINRLWHLFAKNIFVHVFEDSVTDGQMDGPSYRDSRTHQIDIQPTPAVELRKAAFDRLSIGSAKKFVYTRAVYEALLNIKLFRRYEAAT